MATYSPQQAPFKHNAALPKSRLLDENINGRSSSRYELDKFEDDDEDEQEEPVPTRVKINLKATVVGSKGGLTEFTEQAPGSKESL